jgi:DNA mismatch endonuclease (patch repair protein)
MADTLTKAKRSWLMSRVRGANTLPEKQVERFLRRHGVRFRRHIRKLPGTPDIVVPQEKLAIFVNGCFWHGHAGCDLARLPSTRKNFWSEKIRANKERDRRVRRALRQMGWNVLTIWGCRAKSTVHLGRVLATALPRNEDGRPH